MGLVGVTGEEGEGVGEVRGRVERRKEFLQMGILEILQSMKGGFVFLSISF